MAKRFACGLAAGMIAGVMAMTSAEAAGLCKLTGTYKDKYGLATADITKKKGTLTAPAACSTQYTFKITDLTKAGFNVTGKDTTKSCGKFSAALIFDGSCSVFQGSVMINGETFTDVFTKQPTTGSAPKAASDLLVGLH